MADLGVIANSEASRRADRHNGRDYLNYVAVANNDEWNQMFLEIPSNILDADVVWISVEAAPAATPHVVDTGSLREVCSVGVRDGPTGAQRCNYLSDPIADYGSSVDDGVTNGWAALIDCKNEHVTRGDQVIIKCPPADDHATVATGDYTMRMLLTHVNYTKK